MLPFSSLWGYFFLVFTDSQILFCLLLYFPIRTWCKTILIFLLVVSPITLVLKCSGGEPIAQMQQQAPRAPAVLTRAKSPQKPSTRWEVFFWTKISVFRLVAVLALCDKQKGLGLQARSLVSQRFVSCVGVIFNSLPPPLYSLLCVSPLFLCQTSLPSVCDILLLTEGIFFQG